MATTATPNVPVSSLPRGAAAAQPGREHAAVIPGTPPWLRSMLSWLAGKPA
jgi:hypothetical protein